MQSEAGLKEWKWSWIKNNSNTKKLKSILNVFLLKTILLSIKSINIKVEILFNEKLRINQIYTINIMKNTVHE